MYDLNERFKWLRTDVDMKIERTCTGIGQSVHGYCDYCFLCLMTLFRSPGGGMWVCGLDWAGPGQGQVAEACEWGNEPSGSIKMRGIS